MRGGFGATMLLLAGCASYEARPLVPRAELASLDLRTPEGFLVERASAGEAAGESVPAFDAADGFDEAELVALALALHPALAALRREHDIAEAQRFAAGLWPDPEVDVSLLPGLGGTSGTNVELELPFPLLRFGERDARRDAADARREQVVVEVLAAEWELAAAVRLAHLDVLHADENAAQLTRAVELRARALELLRGRRDVGEGNELDVSVAELELAEARRDLRGAETRRERTRRALNERLGLPPGHVLALAELARPWHVVVYDPLSDAELDGRLLDGRSDLRALEAGYARTEHELRLAHVRQFPRLALGPAFAKEDGEKYLGFGISLVLPVFDRNRGEIAERAAQRDRARADYVAALHRARAGAWEARATLARARDEVDAQRDGVLPLVDRNQALYEGAFRAGELSVLDWITAQERALRARRSYLEALVGYRRALIELETALGAPLARPLSGDLDQGGS